MSEDLANRTAGVAGRSPGVVLESPSLFRGEANGAAPPAYEIKFLLSEEEAREVEARLAGRLTPDPHADPTLGGAYRVTSVYTDTPQFDVYRRAGEYGRSKFRARRYGHAGPVFVERKDKTGDKVHKCRSAVPAADLAVLSAAAAPPGWPGGWFHHQLRARRLAPVCRITYERVAYLGTADGGTVRLTFDRRVRGEAAGAWEPVAVGSADELLPGRVVCEFKYRLAMPLVFKEVVRDLGLNPSACSKYRRFVEAAGIAPELADAEANGGGRADG